MILYKLQKIGMEVELTGLKDIDDIIYCYKKEMEGYDTQKKRKALMIKQIKYTRLYYLVSCKEYYIMMGEYPEPFHVFVKLVCSNFKRKHE